MYEANALLVQIRLGYAACDLTDKGVHKLIKVDLLEHITWADDKKSFTISGLTNSEGDESWEYNVELPRFRINQVSSSGETIKTMVVNPQDTLYYESESTTSRPRMYNANEQGWDIKTLKD